MLDDTSCLDGDEIEGRMLIDLGRGILLGGGRNLGLHWFVMVLNCKRGLCDN